MQLWSFCYRKIHVYYCYDNDAMKKCQYIMLIVLSCNDKVSASNDKVSASNVEVTAYDTDVLACNVEVSYTVY